MRAVLLYTSVPDGGSGAYLHTTSSNDEVIANIRGCEWNHRERELQIVFLWRNLC